MIDLRGRTSLFDLLSIVKNRCRAVILPDSGLLAMIYYLDESFPIEVISLWADPYQGVLKQNVASPNPQLVHRPLIGLLKDLSTLTADTVMREAFHVKPLYKCLSFDQAPLGSLEQVGGVLLAGGQGSRLGFEGPKGAFPLLGKSLFQWICEQAPPKDFPIAVMTSPLNHEATVSFFARHKNFGREVHFFVQEMLPFLDEEKREVIVKGRTVVVPSGNGGVYCALANSPIASLFAERGIRWVTILPVENPLAHPADRYLIGHAERFGAEVVVKCVPRESPEESMGVLVEREGAIEIQEYIHLDRASNVARGSYSYTGMMAMSFSFFLQMAQVELPLHWVKKRLPGRDRSGWKREQFLFDVLPFAKRVSALCYPRATCYAPLKDPHSIAGVEQLLTRAPNR